MPLKPKFRRIVVKIGSSVLSDDKGLKVAFFTRLATQIATLKRQGVAIVVVSSGAVAAAMAAFGADKKPALIPEKQAFAAYGQPLLMARYIAAFSRQDLKVAQILLTHPDLADRGRFLNARQVFDQLLARDIIPIVNENDSVAVDELKFGDNDRLSASVANLVQADLLVILSHVDGLYDADPSTCSEARLVDRVTAIDEELLGLVFHNKNERGTGGMASKLDAAQACLDFGIPVFVTNGAKADCLIHAVNGDAVGTLFVAEKPALSARKHWIGRVLKPCGEIVIDDGARRALVERKKSLLPSGIVSVSGAFDAGECVLIRDSGGKPLARGLVLYAARELERIKGRKSGEIASILGYKNADEAVYRDDLVIIP